MESSAKALVTVVLADIAGPVKIDLLVSILPGRDNRS